MRVLCLQPVLASVMVPVLPSDSHSDLSLLSPSPGGSGMLTAFYQVHTATADATRTTIRHVPTQDSSR